MSTSSLFRRCLVACAFLFPVIASAQTCDLFFSEYLEGASNNKAVEIFNSTNTTVSLSDYVIYRYNNGASIPTDSLHPDGNLAPGGVYVAGNPSAVAAILAVSDTLHTITFFNGDDALVLKHKPSNTILDVIGIVGVDPGVNWSVGTGATSEFTLVRMSAVQQGTTNWALSVNQWDVYPQNTTTFLGSHTGTPCCVNSSSNITALACSSFTAPSGAVFTSSGLYTDTITNAAGCDSIITINLIVNQPTTSSLTMNSCGPYTAPSGAIFTSGGVYNDTISNAAGCDSIITINLTVNQPTTSSLNTTSCGPYTAPSGAVFTISGTYTDTISNAAGCDSVITINLTVNSINAQITQSAGYTLNCAQGGATYQWVDCGDNYSPVAGATGQSFNPTLEGNYAVIITLGSCSDTSNCLMVLFSGLDETDDASLQLAPNPVKTSVVLTTQHPVKQAGIRLMSLSGQTLLRQNNLEGSSFTIDLSGISEGIYIVELQSASGIWRRRLVKQ